MGEAVPPMCTAARLRKSADFRDVRKRGRRVSDRLMTFDSAPSDGDATRFGLVVSKRVGGAVTRNKVKRRLRGALSSLDVLPGYDIVVSARPAAADADYHMLLSSLKRLAERAGVLKPDATDPVNDCVPGAVTRSAIHEGAPEGKTG